MGKRESLRCVCVATNQAPAFRCPRSGGARHDNTSLFPLIKHPCSRQVAQLHVKLRVKMAAASYNVYLAESLGGGNSDHHAILVEPAASQSALPNFENQGYLYQVKGNIAQGMTYEFRQAKDEDFYLGKTLLGTVDADDFNCIDRICSALPPPKKQFNGPKRLYPREKLYKCQAWTRDVLRALEAEGVLKSVHGVAWQEIHEGRRAETWSI